MNSDSNRPERAYRDRDSEQPPERTGSRVADVGTSAALGAAAAGALAGAVAGPVGAAVGAVVGGLAAGYAGNEIAESVDRRIEEAYWQEQYKQRPYVEDDATFDDYGPAYGHGVDGFIRHPGRTFDDAESDLSREWANSRGRSRLEWDSARNATRDAWDRIAESVERKRR